MLVLPPRRARREESEEEEEEEEEGGLLPMWLRAERRWLRWRPRRGREEGDEAWTSDDGGGEGRTAAGKTRRGVLEAEATVRLRRERRRRAGREEEEPQVKEEEVDGAAKGSIII